MDRSANVKRARVLLDAVHSICNVDIVNFQHLIAQNPSVLTEELCLRLLLSYLPETVEPTEIENILLQLGGNPSKEVLPDSATRKKGQTFGDSEDAIRQARRLALKPLDLPVAPFYRLEGPVEQFLYHQSHQIAAVSGSLIPVCQLLGPHVAKSWRMRNWVNSIVLPLLRLQYTNHDRIRHSSLQLESLEENQARDTLSLLLSLVQGSTPDSHSIAAGEYFRDVIAPYTLGCAERSLRETKAHVNRQSDRKVQRGIYEDLQSQINTWLLDLTSTDPERASEAVAKWDGPDDVADQGWLQEMRLMDVNMFTVSVANYCQAMIAMLYAASQHGLDERHEWRIINRVAQLSGLEKPVRSGDIVVSTNLLGYMENLKQTNLLQHELLGSDNALTTPAGESVEFANLCSVSKQMLKELGLESSLRSVAQMTAFASKPDQHRELMRLLEYLQSRPREDLFWATARSKILWLRDWGRNKPADQQVSDGVGVFCLLDNTEIEAELFRSMLLNEKYHHAIQQYCTGDRTSFSPEQIEKLLYDVIMFTFDSASNGNRTHGELRKASEMVSTFQNVFPKSKRLQEIKALIAATHSMSFYSLTLDHGGPFQPVSVRTVSDPLSLVEKILKQNPRSYTKLDDLIQIGVNLLKALPNSTANTSRSLDDVGANRHDNPVRSATKQVCAMAIQEALDEDDFDTAYAYVVNRLDHYNVFSANAAHDNDEDVDSEETLWHVAYQAGCFDSLVSSQVDLIKRLEQRMELLSLALQSAPSSSLTEVLSIWRQCESQLNAMIAKEKKEREDFDTQADQEVPGAFNITTGEVQERPRRPPRANLGEEAPIGLFDVAKGAASAFRRSAFPLGQGKTSQQKPPMMPSSGINDDQDAEDTTTRAEHRVRKRDVVSNMVTGGILSSVGWVIGAPVAREPD